MSPHDETETTPWEQLAEVGRYPSLDQAHEHGLVVLAMRQPCWVSESVPPGQYSLHADPAAVAEITREIEAYENEREVPKSAPDPLAGAFRYPAGWSVYGCWATCLVLVFLLQGANPVLVERGASSSLGLIGKGEWWRPFTALFLHADLSHLLGNLLSGLFFGTLAARMIGAWRAWLLILLSGAVGNLVTSALAWPDPFRSIGASTAVFGALGILSGLGFLTMLRDRGGLPWARIAAPLIAGVILLGWLGGGGGEAAAGGGGQTDVMGHMAGFAAGLVAGLCVGWFTPATAGGWTAGNAKAEHDGPT